MFEHRLVNYSKLHSATTVAAFGATHNRLHLGTAARRVAAADEASMNRLVLLADGAVRDVTLCTSACIASATSGTNRSS